MFGWKEGKTGLAPANVKPYLVHVRTPTWHNHVLFETPILNLWGLAEKRRVSFQSDEWTGLSIISQRVVWCSSYVCSLWNIIHTILLAGRWVKCVSICFPMLLIVINSFALKTQVRSTMAAWLDRPMIQIGQLWSLIGPWWASGAHSQGNGPATCSNPLTMMSFLGDGQGWEPSKIPDSTPRKEGWNWVGWGNLRRGEGRLRGGKGSGGRSGGWSRKVGWAVRRRTQRVVWQGGWAKKMGRKSRKEGEWPEGGEAEGSWLAAGSRRRKTEVGQWRMGTAQRQRKKRLAEAREKLGHSRASGMVTPALQSQPGQRKRVPGCGLTPVGGWAAKFP